MKDRLTIGKAPRNNKWYWYAKDVRGVVCGKSHKGFSSKTACEHNASVTQMGLTQGLKTQGYNR